MQFTHKPKLIALSFLILSIQGIAIGQGLYDLSAFYRNSWQTLNPAAVDYVYIVEDKPIYYFNGTVRQQYAKLGQELAPKVYNANFEIHPLGQPIKFGGLIHQYISGGLEHARIQGNFAYQINLGSKKHYISVGLNAGVAWFNLDLSNYAWVTNRDKYAVVASEKPYPDIAIGAFYVRTINSFNWRSENGVKKYFFGLSIPKTFISERYSGFEAARPADQFDFILPVYVLGGIEVQVMSFLKLEPTVWIRWGGITNPGFNGIPDSVDGRITATVLNKFWGQVGFDTANNAYGALGSFFPLEVAGEQVIAQFGVGVDFNTNYFGALGPSLEAIFGIAW